MKKIRKKRIVDVKSMFLMQAVIKNNIKLLKFAVKMGADINKKVYGYTPIECACIYQNNQAIKVLAALGCKLNYSGSIICHVLAEYDQYNILKALVRKGLDVNRKDRNGKTGLHWAAEKGCVKSVAVLLESGADVNVMDEENMSPLAIACINGNYEVADLLIKYNADVNCRDGEGRTSLFYAKAKQLKKIQQLLLVNGADDRKN